MFHSNRRSALPELMDQPGIPEAEIRQNLRELEVVGRRLGGYSVAIGALRRLHQEGRTLLEITDMGSGGGDTARAIAQWAARRQIPIRITGIDRNPMMTAYAQETSAGYSNVFFKTCDVLDDALLQAPPPDVVMSSLFCHHFDEEALPHLLRRMMQLCRTAVIVNDLHRHPAAYYSIKMLTALFSKSRIVRYDAPLSVARAFVRKDLEAAMAAAGIRAWQLHWRWAWRWQLIIPKQEI